MSLTRALAIASLLTAPLGAQAADALTAVTVWPESVRLSGPRDARQLVVTGVAADGSPRDLTRETTVTGAGAVVRVGAGLFLRPGSKGATTLTLAVAGRELRVPVTVGPSAGPVSFRREVVGVLNVGGCNAGACHGTPSGKNGFKLSLRGFDPAADLAQLTRDQSGRRVDPLRPEASLVLLKPLGRVPHEGGARLAAGDYPAEMLAAWLAAGTPDDAPSLPAVTGLEVAPGPRVLRGDARTQQLAAVATFADGTTRDVTRLTVFSSSEPLVAEVGPTGLVTFRRTGEVAILARYLETLATVRMSHLEPRPGFAWPDPPATNFVDTHAFAKLKTLSIAPSDLCTDADFVRRVTLDVAGRLPTPAETRAFVADPSSGKRERLIDRLLDSPGYADFWALKWADVLRASRKTMQAKGTAGLQRWLRAKLAADAPFDGLARDLLTATGDTHANPPANYYRAATTPTDLAEGTAQLFLGVRMQCAKCHNHPSEKWSQDDYYGLAAVFARVGQQKVDGVKPRDAAKHSATVVALRAGEVTQPRTGRVMPPRFPLAGEQDLPAGADRRAAFADWLTAPGNAFFAKAVSNRVWFHLMGRGIVDPVDDFRESNPSANDELLDALAADFTAHNFRLKPLIRAIVTSRTYQLAAEPNATNAADDRYFSHAAVRPLTAEQLLDALSDVTGVPEKFAGLPAGTRAVQLPDPQSVDGGGGAFLKAFGQPARELACECERESDSNLSQSLQLVNGATVHAKLRHPANRLTTLLAADVTDRVRLDELYVAAVSRPASGGEAAVALKHVAAGKDRRRAWEDVLWALVNTREFLFQH